MDRSKNIVRVSIVGIIVNIVLVAFKAAVGFITGSIAVILDAVNNLSDALSSVITIVGTKLANRKPDKKHPYGYGRIEHISSVAISVLVLAAGVTSLKESVEKMLHPELPNYTVGSLVIIAAAVVAKFLLGRYVKTCGKKYNSDALIASGTDASFDSVISLSTLVAAGVSMLFSVSIEGILGVVISLLIIKAAVEILLESLSGIIGARIDSELSTSLKAHIRGINGVLGAYDLVLHRYGPERIIGSVHIEVPDTMAARDVHALSQKIVADVEHNFGILLTVGIYAANTTDGIGTELSDKVRELIKDEPHILQMHGLYADTETKQVSFDLVISFKADDKFALRSKITDKLCELYPEYSFSANIDTDFSD